MFLFGGLNISLSYEIKIGVLFFLKLEVFLFDNGLLFFRSLFVFFGLFSFKFLVLSIDFDVIFILFDLVVVGEGY